MKSGVVTPHSDAYALLSEMLLNSPAAVLQFLLFPEPMLSGLLYTFTMTDQKHWPHSPNHKVDEAGTYMITAGTYKRQRFLNTREKLHFVHDTLLQTADDLGWRLQAWAILANHYHFIAFSPDKDAALSKFVGKFHMMTSKRLNQLDDTPGRKVWFQFWDNIITYQASYLARLNYVHSNPVHHGLVEDAVAYLWCSAAWFEQSADSSFYQSVRRVKMDQLQIRDDF